jgi:26S proteasome regulatory subunit N2
MHLLEPYLPETPNAENPDANPVSAEGGYAEGGSLYALGLIHGSNVGSSSAKREEANSFLRGHLRNSHANEAISHGSALGVGLTALGTNNIEVVNELKELLYTDSAVAGEGAGIAIGMVLVGSGAGNVNNSVDPQDAQEIADIIFELKNYAKETQHEKIIRGIVMGLALINFGQEENADTMIDEMRSDRDPLLRYGAQYTLALAYCGTGSNKAIRLLLHTAVSDVSDDVRMAAVIGLAFVLYKTPDRVPQLVKLLLESFNPHVRYASCMAVGMAMAGTGDSESVAMLEPMLTDMSDFVRQGALMGTALIYMQQADSCNSKKIKLFREKLSSLLTSKHQTSLTKMGAILSTGIIDAGGRNCSFDLGSKNGFTKMNTAVGAALWLQHWYWYPMMHMFSLAITPTFTIALNKDFKYPKNFEIECNSKPSTFAYPKHLEEKKEVEKKRVETVTLSITAKNNARLARKKAKEEGDDTPMEDVKEEKIDKEKSEGKEGEAMEIDGEEGKKPKKKKEPEPKSFTLSNPCRITKAQANVCSFGQSQRYYPVRSEEKPRGVILVTDSRPGEEEDLGTVKPPSIESEDEPDAPEPFVWTPPGYTEPIPEEEDSSPATE